MERYHINEKLVVDVSDMHALWPNSLIADSLTGFLGGKISSDNLKCIISGGCLLRNIDIILKTSTYLIQRTIWYKHCIICNRCLLWRIL